MYKKINFAILKDPNVSLVHKIISVTATIAIFALLIVLLPTILLFLLSLFLIMGIISLILRFFIAKEVSNVKFVYRQNPRDEKHDEQVKDNDTMIDVTHSAQKDE